VDIGFDAPPATVNITVIVQRLASGELGRASIIITYAGFYGTSGIATNYINVTLKNKGTASATISYIKVNDIIKTFSATNNNFTLPAGDINHVIEIHNVGWVNGNPYKIDIYDLDGILVGSTQQNSPSG